MSWSPWYNVIIAVLMVYVAFAKWNRPMSWERFWINIIFAATNLVTALWIWVA